MDLNAPTGSLALKEHSRDVSVACHHGLSGSSMDELTRRIPSPDPRRANVLRVWRIYIQPRRHTDEKLKDRGQCEKQIKALGDWDNGSEGAEQQPSDQSSFLGVCSPWVDNGFPITKDYERLF